MWDRPHIEILLFEFQIFENIFEHARCAKFKSIEMFRRSDQDESLTVDHPRRQEKGMSRSSLVSVMTLGREKVSI